MTLLTGKTILVTGGASGIGRATAQQLSVDGAHVAIADIHERAAQEVANTIVAAGGSADAFAVDIADEDAVRATIKEIVSRHGSLDGAFNNAGIEGPTAKIVDVSMADWERVLRVNLTGVFVCLKCEIEQMLLQSEGGCIVSTASVAGLVGLAGAASYNAAKHGVVGLTKTVALEYASRNIRVNAVCPGFIDTPMLDRVTDASVKIRDQLIAAVPMRRVAQAGEIADVVAWLLSERSSYMNGVAVPVDGGWVAQ
jgi:NAD(P)-dependent dehydrogenase (short-subunit alcohol dehydrogenase family)